VLEWRTSQSDGRPVSVCRYHIQSLDAGPRAKRRTIAVGRIYACVTPWRTCSILRGSGDPSDYIAIAKCSWHDNTIRLK